MFQSKNCKHLNHIFRIVLRNLMEKYNSIMNQSWRQIIRRYALLHASMNFESAETAIDSKSLSSSPIFDFFASKELRNSLRKRTKLILSSEEPELSCPQGGKIRKQQLVNLLKIELLIRNIFRQVTRMKNNKFQAGLEDQVFK